MTIQATTLTGFMQEMRIKYQDPSIQYTTPKQLLADINQDIDDIAEKLYYAEKISWDFKDDLKSFLLSAMNIGDVK